MLKQTKKMRHSIIWYLRRILVLSMVFCLGASICFFSGCMSANNTSQETAEEISAQDLTVDEKVEKIIANMSDAEKAGQLVMVGVQGIAINDDIKYLLNEYNIGGVILFDRNMESQEQVAEFNKQLQASAGGELPLFIAVDEEGGAVARMKESLPPPPAQREIGMTGKPEHAKVWAAKTAQRLKNIGFNVNFAPVADVGQDSIGRMYSGDANIVVSFVEAAVNGYGMENMLCSLKHFPGIGRGKEDSHDDFVSVSAGEATLNNTDMHPFKYMIDHGNPDNYWIMVTHVTYSALDPDNPASLSKVVMTDLLRDKLGYKGIIITDDLDMGAIAKYYDYSDVGVRAIEAGADIVMVCHEYEHEIAAYNGILRAVESGRISKERLDSSVKRVIKAKLLHLL